MTERLGSGGGHEGNPSHSLDNIVEHVTELAHQSDFRGVKEVGSQPLERLTPRQLLSVTLKPDWEPFLEKLENLDPGTLERFGCKSVTEYLVKVVIKMVSYDAPEPFMPEQVDIYGRVLAAISQRRRMAEQKLLANWSEKGLV